MQQGWHPDDQPHSPAITPLGWVRAILRGVLLAVVLVVGLLLLLLVRLLERPIWGLHRPVSPHITRIVCRLSLIILNIRCRVQGAMMDHPGAVVANHSSWVDIFVLNATRPVYFVSKSEVADWPRYRLAGTGDGHSVYPTGSQRGKGADQGVSGPVVGGAPSVVFPGRDIDGWFDNFTF